MVHMGRAWRRVSSVRRSIGGFGVPRRAVQQREGLCLGPHARGSRHLSDQDASRHHGEAIGLRKTESEEKYSLVDSNAAYI